MQFLSKLRYRVLFLLWGVLFAVTAVLGLFFPGVENPWGLAGLRCVSILFFLPPWMILLKAQRENNRRRILLIRYLALAWLVLALALVCASIMSVNYFPAMGNLLHILLTVICTPMVCSNFYALPMFLWATLLIGSFGKKK